MSEKLKEVEFKFNVNLEGIIGFNSNLGENGPWGSYHAPFHSHQFISPPSQGKGKPEPIDGIPIFPANHKIKLIVEPNSKELIEKYQFCVEYMRLVLIGPYEFTHSAPRTLWEEILDVDKTHGAVGAMGDFFLSQSDNVGKFEITTSPDLNALSYNIQYEVCFSITLNGYIKYCIIDPLIKTSSGHT